MIGKNCDEGIMIIKKYCDKKEEIEKDDHK